MKKVLAIASVAILAVAGCTDEFKANCIQQGGQVMEKTHTDYGITMDGRVTWVIASTRFCKANGVIVDVE